MRVGKIEQARDGRRALLRLALYLKPHWLGISGVLVLVLGYTLLGLLGPYLMGVAIDRFINGKDPQGLAVIAGAMLAVYVLNNLFQAAANWVMGDLAALANASGFSVAQTHVPPAHVAELVDLIAENTISGKIAKDMLALMFGEERGASPREIVERRGLKQVTDTGAIEREVDAIIAANPDKVEQAKAKPTMLGWFVGQVMKASGGKANPGAVNEMLKSKLGL